MSVIEIYVVAVVHLGLVPALLYPWHYRRSPWRQSAVGRALMTKGLAVAALFAVGVVGFWWPFPGYQFIYAGVVTFVVAAIAYQYRVMRELQRGPNPHF